MARRMQREVVVLPQPLSPTRASVSPSPDREADVVDGAHCADRLLEEAAPDREELLEVADVEQWSGRRSTAPSVPFLPRSRCRPGAPCPWTHSSSDPAGTPP